MGTLVQLAGFRNTLASRAIDAAREFHCLGQADFTPRDHDDLDGWATRDRLVAINSCEMGSFAMLYHDGVHWASWGIVRQGGEVLVWDCVTLADIGRFPSMVDALAALPVARRASSTPSVLPFAAADRRCVAAF